MATSPILSHDAESEREFHNHGDTAAHIEERSQSRTSTKGTQSPQVTGSQASEADDENNGSLCGLEAMSTEAVDAVDSDAGFLRDSNAERSDYESDENPYEDGSDDALSQVSNAGTMQGMEGESLQDPETDKESASSSEEVSPREQANVWGEGGLQIHWEDYPAVFQQEMVDEIDQDFPSEYFSDLPEANGSTHGTETNENLDSTPHQDLAEVDDVRPLRQLGSADDERDRFWSTFGPYASKLDNARNTEDSRNMEDPQDIEHDQYSQDPHEAQASTESKRFGRKSPPKLQLLEEQQSDKKESKKQKMLKNKIKTLQKELLHGPEGSVASDPDDYEESESNHSNSDETDDDSEDDQIASDQKDKGSEAPAALSANDQKPQEDAPASGDAQEGEAKDKPPAKPAKPAYRKHPRYRRHVRRLRRERRELRTKCENAILIQDDQHTMTIETVEQLVFSMVPGEHQVPFLDVIAEEFGLAQERNEALAQLTIELQQEIGRLRRKQLKAKWEHSEKCIPIHIKCLKFESTSIDQNQDQEDWEDLVGSPMSAEELMHTPDLLRALVATKKGTKMAYKEKKDVSSDESTPRPRRRRKFVSAVGKHRSLPGFLYDPRGELGGSSSDSDEDLLQPPAVCFDRLGYQGMTLSPLGSPFVDGPDHGLEDPGSRRSVVFQDGQGAGEKTSRESKHVTAAPDGKTDTDGTNPHQSTEGTMSSQGEAKPTGLGRYGTTGSKISDPQSSGATSGTMASGTGPLRNLTHAARLARLSSDRSRAGKRLQSILKQAQRKRTEAAPGALAKLSERVVLAGSNDSSGGMKSVEAAAKDRGKKRGRGLGRRLRDSWSSRILLGGARSDAPSSFMEGTGLSRRYILHWVEAQPSLPARSRYRPMSWGSGASTISDQGGSAKGGLDTGAEDPSRGWNAVGTDIMFLLAEHWLAYVELVLLARFIVLHPILYWWQTSVDYADYMRWRLMGRITPRESPQNAAPRLSPHAKVWLVVDGMLFLLLLCAIQAWIACNRERHIWEKGNGESRTLLLRQIYAHSKVLWATGVDPELMVGYKAVNDLRGEVVHVRRSVIKFAGSTLGMLRADGAVGGNWTSMAA